ncbi:hypothetical protein NEUTE2DRAFT_54818 [Neurospora tetrasperma FGSC 2509]|nr:hypothetical protein NEUTE2DRAFT_54818 [Neurospora tetrasperma FGSC 2509]
MMGLGKPLCRPMFIWSSSVARLGPPRGKQSSGDDPQPIASLASTEQFTSSGVFFETMTTNWPA